MKLQVGRTYLDGEGTKCRIVEYDARLPFPFADEHGCLYTEYGVSGEPGYPKLNLICEVVDPEELREEIAELRRELMDLRDELREELLELYRRIANP